MVHIFRVSQRSSPIRARGGSEPRSREGSINWIEREKRYSILTRVEDRRDTRTHFGRSVKTPRVRLLLNNNYRDHLLASGYVRFDVCRTASLFFFLPLEKK